MEVLVAEHAAEIAQQKEVTGQVVAKLKQVLATYRQLQVKCREMEQAKSDDANAKQAEAEHEGGALQSAKGAAQLAQLSDKVRDLAAREAALQQRNEELESRAKSSSGDGDDTVALLAKEQQEKAKLLAKLKQIVPKFRDQQNALHAAEVRTATDAAQLAALAGVESRLLLSQQEATELQRKLASLEESAAEGAGADHATDAALEVARARIGELERALSTGNKAAEDASRAATKASRKAGASARVAANALKKKTAEVKKLDATLLVARGAESEARAALETETESLSAEKSQLVDQLRDAREREEKGLRDVEELSASLAASRAESDAAAAQFDIALAAQERGAQERSVAAADAATANAAAVRASSDAASRAALSTEAQKTAAALSRADAAEKISAALQKELSLREAAVADLQSAHAAAESALVTAKESAAREVEELEARAAAANAAAARQSSSTASGAAQLQELRTAHAVEMQRRDAVRERRKAERAAAGAAKAAAHAAELVHVREERDRRIAELAVACTELDEARSGAARSATSHATAVRELDAARESILQLRSESVAQASELRDATEAGAQLRNAASNSLSERSAQLEAQEEANAQLVEKLRAAELDATERDGIALTRGEEVPRLEKALQQAESKLRNSEDEVSTLRAAASAEDSERAAETDALHVRVQEGEDAVARLENELSKCRAAAQEKAESPPAAAVRDAELDAHIVALESELERVKLEREQLVEKLRSVVGRYREQQSQLQQSEERAAMDATRLQDAETQLAAAKSELHIAERSAAIVATGTATAAAAGVGGSDAAAGLERALRMEVSEATQLNEALKAALEAEAVQREGQVTAHEAALLAQRSVAAKNSERIAELEGEKAQLVAKMKEILSKYRQLQQGRQQDKEVTAVRIKSVTEQVRRELEGIEAARDSSSNEAERLRRQLDLLGARCMALETEVETARSETNPLRATIATLRGEHATAVATAANASTIMQREMAAFREKVQLETMQSLQVMEREHRRRLASSDRRRDEAIADLAKRDEEATAKISAAESAAGAAAERSDALDAAMQAATAEVSAMRARDDELRADAMRVEEATALRDASEARCATLQSEVHLLRSNIAEVARSHREQIQALQGTTNARSAAAVPDQVLQELEILRDSKKQLEQALRDVRKRDAERAQQRAGAEDGAGALLQATRRKLAAAEAQQDALARSNDALKSGAAVSRAMKAIALLQKQVEMLKAQGVQTPAPTRQSSGSGSLCTTPQTPHTPVSSMPSLTPVAKWTGGGTPLPSVGAAMGPPRSQRVRREPSTFGGAGRGDEPRALNEANLRCSDMAARVELLEASLTAERQISGRRPSSCESESEHVMESTPLKVMKKHLKDMQRLLGAAQRRLADRAAFGAEVLALRHALRDANKRNTQGKQQIAQLAALVATGAASRGGRRQRSGSLGAAGEAASVSLQTVRPHHPPLTLRGHHCLCTANRDPPPPSPHACRNWTTRTSRCLCFVAS